MSLFKKSTLPPIAPAAATPAAPIAATDTEAVQEAARREADRLRKKNKVSGSSFATGNGFSGARNTLG